MKAFCHREGLLTACQLASVAIPTKEAKPILRNLKAIADNGRCTLMATDLELGIRLDVLGLTIQEPGEAILPAKQLLDILRESQEADLTIETNNSTCTVRGLSMEFEMPSDDPAHFPDISTFNDTKYHEVPSSALREMIRRTVFATADESTRYSMTGVLWELDGDALKLVATDGRRLAVAQGTAKAHGDHTTKGQTPVVPTKAMQLLERNLSDGETIRVCIRQNEALFRTELATIYTRLVEGRYPDYKQVFPKKQAIKIGLQVGAFHAAVRQAAIMTDNDSKRVTFRFANDKLTLMAQGQTGGRSKVELPITYDGKQVDINFNPTYVADMLKILGPDADLSLDLVDGATPALFKSGANYSYLVMPLT